MEPQYPLYPLSLRLEGRRVVVVGGGPVALRRVAGLRAARADVMVIAPELSPSLADMAARGLVAVRGRPYQPGDLDGAWLAHACTDQPEVNAQVAAEAERLRIWCVRADDRGASAAWAPAVGRVAGATVAVNADGDPRRAAALRDRCVDVIESAARDARAAGEPGPPAGAGRVAVVGGGPGDPGLLTVAGLRLLREADVVVTDRLAPLASLADLPADVEVIDAAKVPGGPAMRQEHINRVLVEHARAGRAVVRLKGGDPFVFGRGREEVEACLAAGVPVTVVPGVTSAVSVPAAAGIPVTHRGLSQGFTVVTGHVPPAESGAGAGPDWAALARSRTTLVLLMAVENLPDIAGALLAAGMAADTPSACVADGWAPGQRTVAAPLDGIARAVRTAGIVNPAVIVIGQVAGLSHDTAAAAAGEWAAPQPPAPRPAAPAPAPAASGGTPPGPAAAVPGEAAVPREAPGPGEAGPGSAERAKPGHGLAGVSSGAAVAAGSRGDGRRVLVLGGARSGKSATAEGMLAGHEKVCFVATGPLPGDGDAEWDERVREHRRRRPAGWQTAETLDVEAVLAAPDARTPVLVDCLATWLTRVMDECGVFDGAGPSRAMLAGRVGRLISAWEATGRQVIAVSNEVGSGVVPATASGRLFRDELGALNARLAARSDEVWLCTAGIARRLR